jgi:hypothetical protein
MTYRKMEESLKEDLTRAALAHDAKTAGIGRPSRDFDGPVKCEGVERSSALQSAASEVVIRTRADLEAALPHSLRKSRLNRHL